MGKTNTKGSAVPPSALELCNHFWVEYHYRHDLIWQRIFRFTTAVVLISIIPYIQQEVATRLGFWITLAPLLATFLAVFVLRVMRNEFTLFDRIVTAYWRNQNKLLPKDLKHDIDAERPFTRFVMSYLYLLAGTSLANALIVLLVWLPSLAANPPVAK